ncbi:MAG: 2Fe-2S iron-sulfur cluster-binding protein [Rhizobiaceae bacterium]
MKVTWVLPDGSEKTADVDDGTTLMEAAVANNIPNVIGECGGCLSCATCHVYVDDGWVERTGSADEFEDTMLDVAEAERRESSRLSCQITMNAELDGIRLVVPVPE